MKRGKKGRGRGRGKRRDAKVFAKISRRFTPSNFFQRQEKPNGHFF